MGVELFAKASFQEVHYISNDGGLQNLMQIIGNGPDRSVKSDVTLGTIKRVPYGLSFLCRLNSNLSGSSATKPLLFARLADTTLPSSIGYHQYTGFDIVLRFYFLEIKVIFC